MVEMPTELREKMKEQRLNQYRTQIFTLEMDLKALDAVGNTAEAVKVKQSIEDLTKAYAAVEVM